MYIKTILNRRAFLAISITTLLFGSIMLFSARPLVTQSLIIRSSGNIAPTAPVVTLPLHVEGKWIKDSDGNIVTFYGVFKPGEVDHPSGLWDRSRTFDPQDVIHNLDAMKSWGMNAIRMFYPVDYWIDNPDNFRQHIKDVVNLAAERGIYIFFCGRQVINYPDGGRQDALPYPPYQDGSGYVGAENYIASEQDYIDLMVSIANELGTQVGYNNVIFELWNEPHGAGMLSWFSVVQQTIDAIRATGAENLILVQWNYDLFWRSSEEGWHNHLDWIDWMGLTGTNIFYSTHIYMKDGGLGAPTSVEDARTRLTDCMVPYYNDRVPLVIGEISGNINDPVEQQGFAYTLEVLNEWNIGYLGWWWRHDGIHPLISDYYPNYTPTSNGEILRNAIAAAG